MILKEIVASSESGIGEKHASEDPPLQKLRRELNAETPRPDRGRRRTQWAEEGKAGTEMRGRCGLNIGNVSRDSYRLSIDLFVYCMVIRTASADSDRRGGSGGLRELGPSGLPSSLRASRVNGSNGFVTAKDEPPKGCFRI
jgi:hypothetical protein